MGFSACYIALPVNRLGAGKRWGGNKPGTADHMTMCSAIKAGGRRRMKGAFGIIASAFPSNHHM